MTERSSADAALRDRLCRVEESIARACADAGRARDEVTLLAVTKTVPIDDILAAIRLGVRHVGENRVQEYMEKRPALPAGVRTQLIGHLQSNKVRRIVGEVDQISAVDTLPLAQKISAVSVERGIVTDALVEVNIGGEAAKSGVAPDRLEELLAGIAPLPGIRVRGLMTVPPVLTEEKARREVFSKMYRLFIDIRGKKYDNISMDELSMGMSGDHREAILEGSTTVRIGSLIFGARQYPARII